MSDLGVIVKDTAEDMAKGGEKAGAAIAEHFEGIGSELENSVTRYRGAEETGEKAFTDIMKGGAQGAERTAGTVGRDATQTVENTAKDVGAQAESETKNLAAETEQEVAEDAHLHGEGGASEDPVDLVTGEMFLSQLDITLPGALELVIERRHGSAFRHGRWFGTTWASTLDQRLEVDDDGVHVALADGRVLHYPVPTVHGQRVMPVRGPRWPLAWNRQDDVITVEQSETGRVLHFAPAPAPALYRPLSAVTDRAGNRITFGYDAEGVPRDVYHSGGYHLTTEWTETRGGIRISALKLANSAGGPSVMVREFRYDLAGRLTGVVDSSRLPMEFEYDDADRITKWTDRNGYWYRYSYRPDGRVERAEGDGGYLSVAFDYDLDARTTTMTDARGNASVYHWKQSRSSTHSAARRRPSMTRAARSPPSPTRSAESRGSSATSSATRYGCSARTARR